jgi:hypothetical protein
MATGIRRQAAHITYENRRPQGEQRDYLNEFPGFPASTGIWDAETGSMATASATTHSFEPGNFPKAMRKAANWRHPRGAPGLWRMTKRPRRLISGFCLWRWKFGFPETETATGRDRFDRDVTARGGPASGAGETIRRAGRKDARGPSREAVCLQSPP